MDSVFEKLVTLYEKSPVLVAIYDRFDRLRYANAAFREPFFVEEGEEPFWPDLMRRNYLASRGTVIRAGNFDEWLKTTLPRRGKSQFKAFETDLADGRWLWMTETVETDGWMLCIASDITSLATTERDLRQERDSAIKASFTDALTGSANRRYTMERIAEMLSVPAHDLQAVGCLAVFDIDYFKKINDRFGHQIGDLVLVDLAGRIQEEVRRADCFGRLGGEEFGLVMPNTSLEQAELIVERMLSVVRKSRPSTERPDLSYTFSAGIALRRTGDTVSTLYARADLALYSAKRAGRNRIHLESEPPEALSMSGAP